MFHLFWQLEIEIADLTIESVPSTEDAKRIALVLTEIDDRGLHTLFTTRALLPVLRLRQQCKCLLECDGEDLLLAFQRTKLLFRSEERRVGKECRCRWSLYD